MNPSKVEVVKATHPEQMEKVWAIRREVFITEQKVDARMEYEHEEEARHFLASVDGHAVGTARWRKSGEGVKLERFAVLKPYRNHGVGTALLKAVLDDLDTGEKVYLHAQTRAVPFYARHGFEKQGKEFEEAGILHYTMELIR